MSSQPWLCSTWLHIQGPYLVCNVTSCPTLRDAMSLPVSHPRMSCHFLYIFNLTASHVGTALKYQTGCNQTLIGAWVAEIVFLFISAFFVFLSPTHPRPSLILTLSFFISLSLSLSLSLSAMCVSGMGVKEINFNNHVYFSAEYSPYFFPGKERTISLQRKKTRCWLTPAVRDWKKEERQNLYFLIGCACHI